MKKEVYCESKFSKVSKVIKKNSKVLDIGCSNGELQDFIPSCKYYGIDINNSVGNREMNFKQVNLNINNIPFKEEFDYILLLDVLEHLADPSKTLQDVKSKLSEKGITIINLPNDYHILNKIRFLLDKKLQLDPFSNHGHLHIFPIHLGESFLKKQGFKILKKQILEPPQKPKFIPRFIKEFLAELSPSNFSRGIIYYCKKK
ncbi:class I SAM-dependent methyltransferase [archaeon]|nr:class I SAM-dependent methyltransferase [archaeon]MBT7281622.1 class I SAM-dependent methyltransferase [archaeon]